MENKSLYQIIKGTLLGTDNEGSAKRATGFWLTIFLVSSLVGVEEYCYIIAVSALVPTAAQMVVVKSHESVIWSILISGMIYSGLTSVDKIIDFFKFLKGGNQEKESIKTEKNYEKNIL